MNKLLIALSIFAFLSFGAVYFVSQNQANLMGSSLTIDEWQQCYQKLSNNQCSQAGNSKDVQECNIASDQTQSIIQNGGSSELQACKQWYAYFDKSQAGDSLNYNNYFENCFGSYEVIAAAFPSEYYFFNIYAPKYYTCGGITV